MTAARILGLILAAVASADAAAVEGPIFVTDTASLIEAVSKARAGGEIVVKAGEYVLEAPLNVRAQGRETEPLRIRSETPGAAVLKGTHTMTVRTSKWVTLEGFVFAHRLLPAKQWLQVLDSEQVRVTRCKFAADESGAAEKDAYHSVGIERSSQVRVDHCEFGPRTTRSTGDYVSSHIGSRYLRIDHNHFQHRANIGQNGGETVLLHGGGVWSLHGVVEANLFERCNGEGELIGIKSGRNTVRDNTFINCEGAISIRDGSYNKISGNIILNLLPASDPRADRVSGVRIFGTHNEVVNNYMYRLATPVQGSWGDADPPHEDDGSLSDRRDRGRDLGYIMSRDNLIAHNTIVESACVFQLVKTGIDAGYVFSRIAKVDASTPIAQNLEIYRAHTAGKFVTPHLAPSRWCFLNNLSVNNREFRSLKIFREAQPPYDEEDFTHLGNVNSSTAGAFSYGEHRHFTEAQWRTADPQLVRKGAGLFELDATSPLRGAARRDEAILKPGIVDADTKEQLGQARDTGANLKLKPLTAKDVGIHSE